jgi:nucleotide-binding universal stress UspA family protein
MIPQVKKILFTTDLSRQTRHAFNYAVGLASQYGASLTILYVERGRPGRTLACGLVFLAPCTLRREPSAGYSGRPTCPAKWHAAQ